MKNHVLYKASQPSNPLRTPGGGEAELLELGRWGLYGLAFCSNSAGGGGGAAERVEGGKGRKAGRRQELAPIAIVNPLLAHGDILGLESHKKTQKKLKLKP